MTSLIAPTPLKKPIVLVALDKPEEVIAYACGECGLVVSSHLQDGDAALARAQDHCAPKRCGCGVEFPRKSFYTVCDACRIQHDGERLRARFAAATHLTVAESAQIPHDPVFDPYGSAGRDGYCSDLDEFREHYLDHPDLARPEWVWPTVEIKGQRLDADRLIEDIVQEMHEDAGEEFDAKGLQVLLDEWFAKQNVVSYVEDDSRAIVLDEAFWGVDEEERIDP